MKITLYDETAALLAMRRTRQDHVVYIGSDRSNYACSDWAHFRRLARFPYNQASYARTIPLDLVMVVHKQLKSVYWYRRGYDLEAGLEYWALGNPDECPDVPHWGTPEFARYHRISTLFGNNDFIADLEAEADERRGQPPPLFK